MKLLGSYLEEKWAYRIISLIKTVLEIQKSDFISVKAKLNGAHFLNLITNSKFLIFLVCFLKFGYFILFKISFSFFKQTNNSLTSKIENIHNVGIFKL